jgi:FKBP-type peptidyl-prolyl cis-trans isomerase FkpA
MRTTRIWIAAALLPLAIACAPAEVKLESDSEKAVYGLGAKIGEDLKSRLEALGLTPEEESTLLAGLNDQFAGKTRIDLQDPAQAERFQTFQQERMKSMADTQAKKATAEAEAEAPEAKAFVEKAAQEKGAETLASGLVYLEVEAGKGASPTLSDVVKVHYHGTLRDGTVFDSSKERGEPIEFPVSGVIPCWTEGLQKMKEGGKAKFVCPAAIAYGSNGAGDKIKPGAALAFDVELIKVTKGPTGTN